MTQGRKDPLATGECYHVFTKSIAGFVVFNNRDEFFRMKELLNFHRITKPKIRFSWLPRFEGGKEKVTRMIRQEQALVQIIAYCLMPTHVHFFLKQLAENGTSIFMGRLLNSYARYFNLRHKRKGPLWEGRFKNVLVKTDEQAIHLSRYIHLNPTTANLVSKPEDWEFSSYREYLSPAGQREQICEYKELFNISPTNYKEFVEQYQGDQRELAILKKLLME